MTLDSKELFCDLLGLDVSIQCTILSSADIPAHICKQGQEWSDNCFLLDRNFIHWRALYEVSIGSEGKTEIKQNNKH
jgi:hypothetical protein